jgi:Ca2+-binding EF-hand superfamily protein
VIGMTSRFANLSAIVLAAAVVAAAPPSASADDESVYGHGPMHMYGWGYGHGPMMGGYGHGPMMGGYGYGPMMRGYGYGPMMHGYGHGPMRAPYGRGPAVFHLGMLDTDGNGVVEEEEAAARHESVFTAMDTDGDDALTEDEMLAVRMGPGPMAPAAGPRAERRRERLTKRFELMDKDGDGMVSRAEFMAYGAERFKALDQDGDGTVTVWEYRSHRMN